MMKVKFFVLFMIIASSTFASCKLLEGAPVPPNTGVEIADIPLTPPAIPTITVEQANGLLPFYPDGYEEFIDSIEALERDKCAISGAPAIPIETNPVFGCIYEGTVNDFDMTITVSPASEPEAGANCLLFGVKGKNFYEFCVNSMTSEYLLAGYDEEGYFTRTDWTTFDIEPPTLAEVYELRVVLRGLDFFGYINGEIFLEQYLSHYLGGQLGFGCFSLSNNPVSCRGEVTNLTQSLE
jgi:hypothetical protein